MVVTGRRRKERDRSIVHDRERSDWPAIRAARPDGRDVPLLMVDGLPLTTFCPGMDGSCIFVSDATEGDEDDEEMMEADARKALRRYGVNPDGMTRSQVYERLEAEGGCDLESVVGAVLGGMDYPVRLPGTSR